MAFCHVEQSVRIAMLTKANSRVVDRPCRDKAEFTRKFQDRHKSAIISNFKVTNVLDDKL